MDPSTGRIEWDNVSRRMRPVWIHDSSGDGRPAAGSLYEVAASYKDVFVEHGLPADFLERLAAASAALKASVDARGVAKSRRAGASDGLKSNLKLGQEIVTFIDGALAHALVSDD